MSYLRRTVGIADPLLAAKVSFGCLNGYVAKPRLGPAAATQSSAVGGVIEAAVESAMKRVMGVTDISPRRLMKVAEVSKYLALSDREIYNMIANKEFKAVKQRRALTLDIRELEAWIERKKAE